MSDQEKTEKTTEEAVAEEAPAAAEKTEEPKEAPTEKVKTETAADEAKAEVPEQFKKLVDQIDKLSVLELSELVKVLEAHYGVSAAAQVAVAAAPASSGETDSAADEKATFTVILASAGDQKINIIKAVREITGLGLAESKALVDEAPKPIKENVAKADAEEAKAKLVEAGATVELQ